MLSFGQLLTGLEVRYLIRYSNEIPDLSHPFHHLSFFLSYLAQNMVKCHLIAISYVPGDCLQVMVLTHLHANL